MVGPGSESERERLLRLIADHVLEHGIAELTLRTLGQAIDSNNRMLLYYFTSKEHLIAEALHAAAARFPRFVAAMDVLDRTELPLHDRLVACWAGIGAPENLPLIRLFFEVFGRAAHNPGRYDPFLSGVGYEWTNRVATALRREGVPDPDAGLLARELVAVWRGLQFDLVSTGDPATVTASYALTAAAFARRTATHPARG